MPVSGISFRNMFTRYLDDRSRELFENIQNIIKNLSNDSDIQIKKLIETTCRSEVIEVLFYYVETSTFPIICYLEENSQKYPQTLSFLTQDSTLKLHYNNYHCIKKLIPKRLIS